LVEIQKEHRTKIDADLMRIETSPPSWHLKSKNTISRTIFIYQCERHRHMELEVFSWFRFKDIVIRLNMNKIYVITASFFPSKLNHVFMKKKKPQA
jgi:hypothetical protein